MGLFTSDKNSPMSPLDIGRVLRATAILVVIAGIVVTLFCDGPIADAFSEYAWWVWIHMR